MLKFSVKNLGRISAAEIELAPLVILVGKNNTGKSYLATLIWALAEMNMLNELRGSPRKPAWYRQMIKPFKKGESRRVTFDTVKRNEILGPLKSMIDRRASDFLSNVFAYNGFETTRINISSTSTDDFDLVFEPKERPKKNSDDETDIAITVKFSDQNDTMFFVPSSLFSAARWFSDFLYYELARVILFGKNWRAYRHQLYIPAARTGIMLALPALVTRALDRSEKEIVSLPRPLRAFLAYLTQGRTFNRDESPVRERLRKRLIQGRIEAEGDSSSEFRYSPEGANITLPLHATSSMITELAPLMVALDRQEPSRHIVFEEPEAHLHLEAQREMARLIARLVSSGTRVTLTTHSDTFIQQINNLMVLHDHPNSKDLSERLGYERSDLINPALVTAYEFCPDETGTVVRPIQRTSEGFVVPTLNETLLALAKETIDLRGGRDG